jgi:hypothetical protein
MVAPRIWQDGRKGGANEPKNRISTAEAERIITSLDGIRDSLIE